MIRRTGATRKHKRNYFDESLRIDDGLADEKEEYAQWRNEQHICFHTHRIFRPALTRHAWHSGKKFWIKKNWRHSPTTTGKVSRSVFFFARFHHCSADSDRCSAMFCLTTTQWRRKPSFRWSSVRDFFFFGWVRVNGTAFVPGKGTSTRVVWKWARNGSSNCVLFGVFSTRLVVVTITLSQHFLLLFSFVFFLFSLLLLRASFAHNTLQYYFIA